MSYLHLASTANSSTSSTPSSYLHVNSNGGVSTVPSSNSSSLLGSIGTGKQWTTIGQSSTSSSSSSSTLAQQLLMKQPNLLNVQSSTSSHFENLLASSSQTPIEKNVNNKIRLIFLSNSISFQFELQQEDFPPLPHRNNYPETPSSASTTSNMPPVFQTQTSSNGYNSSSQTQHSQSQSPISFKNSIDTLSSLISRHQASSTNAKTSSGINMTNLPSTTITDQYGLVGLLQVIQQAEKNPDSSILLNFDLTSLGLSKNNHSLTSTPSRTSFCLGMESPNELYPSFVSPFSDHQARVYEIDYQVPIEYQMGMQIREKLPPIGNFTNLNDDTLFFLFYLFGNDYVQLLAAAELYKRDWRYHKEERLWLTRIKNIMPDQKYESYETGVYCVFDVQLWRKTHKSMRIDYDKLDGKTNKQTNERIDNMQSKYFV